MNENSLAILLLGLSPLPQILQLLSKTLQNRADEWMNNGVEGLQFLPPMSSLRLAVSVVSVFCGDRDRSCRGTWWKILPFCYQRVEISVEGRG